MGCQSVYVKMGLHCYRGRGGGLNAPFSEDVHFCTVLVFFRRLFVTCDVFTRYFFVVFAWLFRPDRIQHASKASDLLTGS